MMVFNIQALLLLLLAFGLGLVLGISVRRARLAARSDAES